MKQNTVTIHGPLTVMIENIAGDLQVAGWERPEVSVKTDGEEATLRVEGERVFASAPGDLVLYVPREASLQIANVSGDADIRAVSGSTRMENIGGDLQMRAVGAAVIGHVGGDLSVRGCAGDFSAGAIGSDASLRDVQGGLNIATVGSDLYLRNLSANIQVQAGSDAILYLQPTTHTNINIRAGGDILLRLPAQTDAELSLQGGSPESIRVDFMDVEPGGFGPLRTVKLGSGAAKIHLMAGGELIVTSQSDGTQTQVDFETGGPGEMPPPPGGFGHGFPGVLQDLTNLHERHRERFAQNVQEATQKAERNRERTERRVEAAMRRAEEKMRAAERRTNFAGVVVGRGSVGRPPSPMVPPPAPAPVNEPVSDVERLAVLKMLESKKISLSEAEKLLAALEGK